MRREGARSRALADRLIERLAAAGSIRIVRRDLAESAIPFVDERWIDAAFTPKPERAPEQQAALARSDALVAEAKAADAIVLATPIYNFGPPAAVKAWIDMVARARETFRYTEKGPVGRLKASRAYFIVASGGVEIEGPADFATPYLKHVFSFLGVDEHHVIAADLAGKTAAEADRAAEASIEALTPSAVKSAYA